jgi:GntR family transcriptional regulator/MocR family aminotransferase
MKLAWLNSHFCYSLIDHFAVLFMRPAITIDADSPTPVHRQLYDSWRQGILRGRFDRNTRVPSTRELAKTLQIARSTVAQAYEQLIAEGYLQARHGSGTFVCGMLPEKMLHAEATTKRGVPATSEIQLSQYAARLQDDFQYPRKKPGWISFSHWWPDQAQFPAASWRRLMTRHLRNESPDMFNYAQHAQGYEPLRKEIANYVSKFRAAVCNADQVIVVNGSQQGLDLCARVLLDAGDEVAIEDPGYLGARRVFAACGAKLRPIRVDAEGIVCRDLRKNSKAIYVTPSHQFPTGVAMSLQRRLALIAWSKAHKAIIIEDDYDSEYRYSGAPLPSLQGLGADTPVIYCGTFSKVMFPGLRVGYLIVPVALAPVFRRAKWLSDRNTPILEQAALADFLSEGHLERHIRRMRRVYAGRREALIDALTRHYGPRAIVLGDAAGMHAFARIDDASITERAVRNKVQLRSAQDYYIGPAPPNEFVFGFATLGERAIREGIKRLAP